MTLRNGFLILSLFVGCFSLCGAEPSRKDLELFETKIRPVLAKHCYRCHAKGAKRLKANLLLDTKAGMLKGGDNGPAIVPGNAKKSLLIQALRHQNDLEMPPSGPLPKNVIADFVKWVDLGAPDPRTGKTTIVQKKIDIEQGRQFWSFQPLKAVKPPKASSQWPTSDVDRFLLAKLQEQKLKPAADAEKRVLVRRIYFDVVGLPPTPKQVEDFVADKSPKAIESLVDRLLKSPRFGEKWGRHWLDVAGYADSEGYSSEDPVRPYAYKYRDYVIRSFSQDKPWDQFIREQLAGDEMTSATALTPDRIEKLTATGFLRMAPDGTGTGGVDQSLARNQVMAETIKIVTSSLMGVTVGCAQCHNHRYDPIPQTDYYRLRAIFEPALNWKKWRAPSSRRVSLYTKEDRQQSAIIEKEAKKIDQERLKKQAEYIQRTFNKEVAKLPKELQEKARQSRKAPAKKRTPEQKRLLKEYPSLNVSSGSLYLYDRKAADDLKKYTARASATRAKKPKQDYLRALTEAPGSVPTTYLFHRGDHDQPKQKLSPAGLSILENQKLAPISINDSKLPTTGRRLAFARRLTDGKHPLTARVIVNRIWMHHFGRGIVNTPADFGILGDRPTHPELLDWLATEFMEGGWKLKRIHKRIMLSTTYRQSSRRSPKLEQLDREKRWYGRASIRRLEAEIVRDAILAVTGKLSSKQFGKPVPVRVDLTGQVVLGVDTRDGAGRPTKKVVLLNGEDLRRSIYVQVRRSMPLGVLETFDFPLLAPNCEQRNASTVAPQSLLLMNSELIVKYARLFAERARREAGDDLRRQIELTWVLAFGTAPSTRETQGAEQFVREQARVFQANKKRKVDPQHEALASFCQALLSSNRFLYVD